MFKLKSTRFLNILQLLYYTRSILGGKLDDYGQIQPTAYILASPHSQGDNNNSTVSSDSFGQLQPNFVYQPTMPLNPYNYYYNTDSPPHYPALADESYRYPSYYQSVPKKKKSSKIKSSSSHYRPSSSSPSSSSSSSSWRIKKRRHSSNPKSYYKRYHQEDNDDDDDDEDDDDKSEDDLWLNSINNQGYLNNEYKPKGSKHKKKKKKKHHKAKDSLFGGNDYDVEDNFLGIRDSINSILDYPDVDDLGLGGGGGGDDLLFGDYDDALQEETFIRPSIVDINHGMNLAAAGLGLGKLHGLGPAGLGLGLGGLGSILGLGSRTFGMRRFLRNGVRIFIAILLLPLLLLFIPIPIVSSNTNNNSSGKQDGSSSSNNQLAELSRKMLNSENCIERISCEINHFNEITGMESENYIFTRFMSLVYHFDNLFATFLVRMARGYLHNSEDNRCSRFNCASLKSHLPSR